jgi:hypothetical protein
MQTGGLLKDLTVTQVTARNLEDAFVALTGDNTAGSPA